MVIDVFFDQSDSAAPNRHNSIGTTLRCRPAYVPKIRPRWKQVKDKLEATAIASRNHPRALRRLHSSQHEPPIIATHCRASPIICGGLRRTRLPREAPNSNCRSFSSRIGLLLPTRLLCFTHFQRLLYCPGTRLADMRSVCCGGRYDGLVELLGWPANERHRHSRLAKTA